jgi:hypothetical protein
MVPLIGRRLHRAGRQFDFLVKVAQIFHSLQSRTQRPRSEVAALPAVFTLFLVSIAGRLATLRQ